VRAACSGGCGSLQCSQRLGGFCQLGEFFGERAGLFDIGANLGKERAAFARIAAVFEGIVVAERGTAAARTRWNEDELSHRRASKFTKSEFNSPSCF
jgi:hypothetical protein